MDGHIFIQEDRRISTMTFFHPSSTAKLPWIASPWQNTTFQLPHTLLEVWKMFDHKHVEARKTFNIYDKQLAQLKTL